MVAPEFITLSPSVLIPVVEICSTSVAVAPCATLTPHDNLYWLPALFKYKLGVPPL